MHFPPFSTSPPWPGHTHTLSGQLKAFQLCFPALKLPGGNLYLRWFQTNWLAFPLKQQLKISCCWGSSQLRSPSLQKELVNPLTILVGYGCCTLPSCIYGWLTGAMRG